MSSSHCRRLLPLYLLELELTETVLRWVTRERSDALDRLHTAGVTIPSDDFIPDIRRA